MEQLKEESPNSDNEDMNLMDIATDNKIVAQLLSVGSSAVAAAAAIASTSGESAPKYSFETNPIKRKRLCTRLLQKLKRTVTEYNVRTGEQVIVLITKPYYSVKVPPINIFGTEPLQQVVGTFSTSIIEQMGQRLRKLATPNFTDQNSTLFELPPLLIDGIPTALENMTQWQLRRFIPYMLRFSLKRNRPYWCKPSAKPPWWPAQVPWANVRADVRTKEEKQQLSWTQALRKIVTECYKYHKREDLLIGMDAPTEIVNNTIDVLDENETKSNTETIMHTDDEEKRMVNLMWNQQDGIVMNDNGVLRKLKNITTNADGSISVTLIAEEF